MCTENKEIENKLRIINFINKARWDTNDKEGDTDNYFIPNYHPDVNENDETGEKKLLSHLLAYISDRQTPFMRCFNIGTYVYSYIVSEFYKSAPDKDKDVVYNILNKCFISISIGEKQHYLSAPYGSCKKNPSDSPKSNKNSGPVIFYNKQSRDFFISQNALVYYTYKDDRNKDDEKKDNEENWRFVTEDSENNNTTTEERVIFASRFMPTDIVCIYKTLTNLCEQYNGSFAKFLKDNSENIENLAQAMYQLTYEQIGRPGYKAICDENKTLDSNCLRNIAGINSQNAKLTKNQKEKHWNEVRFQSKRLWCCLRDFIKAAEFRENFKNIIGENKYENLIKNYEGLELPGDVWNANDEFKNCFFQSETTQETNVSKFIREFCNKHKEFYNDKPEKDKDLFAPENFDITFDFVPRMCKKQNCLFCPFYFNKELSKLSDLYHQQKGKTCPILLMSCGYVYKCDGSCIIQSIHCPKQ